MKTRRLRLVPTEMQECTSFYHWAKMKKIDEYLIKNVNEGKRSVVGGYLLKAIGLKPGLPDYYFLLPNKKYLGLWIEMKAQDQKNKKKNKNQEEWIEKLNKMGHYATYAYGWLSAAKIVEDYLADKI